MITALSTAARRALRVFLAGALILLLGAMLVVAST